MLKRIHPGIVALAVQMMTILTVYLVILSQAFPGLSVFEWSLAQGLLAGLFSYFIRMPVWWTAIHLGFIPLVVVALALNISSTWFLVFFLSLWLIYGKTYRTQVPLYLSSQRANQALESLLPGKERFSFVDLGSGCGGLLNNLARTHQNGQFHGIESAPLPFLISKLRSFLGVPNCNIVWGDFWQQDFSQYDVVYAYLSPVPMAALWEKAGKEMRPGSLLISNTFTIPGVTADKSIKLDDFSNSTLYLWKIQVP
ncbi:class I SAM-dependent methyltransferase [Nitrosomonas oligotropha]|uniref:class I SAM-dependent methyltransferase n=1 Tax=Nitrosomonas oligotropha TaxID=42354 RepID=UPI001368DFC5|nr:class I SAM-dependent methyltransferase [Nitrosomonas oligotropha]MXS81781.1 class I SAM-dependent methyltransferase [Nitrosomonas oligotropha]